MTSVRTVKILIGMYLFADQSTTVRLWIGVTEILDPFQNNYLTRRSKWFTGAEISYTDWN